MDSRTKQLGEAPILPMLVKYSLTAMIGMVAHSLYNVVDRIFIGHKVGSIGIAGITIAFPLMMVMFGFAMLVGMGGAALISIRLGEKKPEEAEKVLGNGIVLQFIFMIILMTVGLIYMRPLLRLSGASDTVMPYAVEYTRIILLGAVFQSAAFCLNWFIRSQGKLHIATMTMVIGAIANLILDPILNLFPHFLRLLEPGGTLVISGILKDQVNQVEALLARHGCHDVQVLYRDEWACFIVRRGARG